MTPGLPGRGALTGFAAVLVLAGCLTAGSGAWIHVKARLAQLLVEGAWAATLAGAGPVRPWPWADTWPVARLESKSHGIDLLVLAGSTGRTLAFGPGHQDGSALPGTPGTVIIGGHRDTHFRFLRRVAPGDRLRVQGASGTWTEFRVTGTAVADIRRQRLSLDAGGDLLTLVTCYPFDALLPGGPLRYVVEAVPVGGGVGTRAG